MHNQSITSEGHAMSFSVLLHALYRHFNLGFSYTSGCWVQVAGVIFWVYTKAVGNMRSANLIMFVEINNHVIVFFECPKIVLAAQRLEVVGTTQKLNDLPVPQARLMIFILISQIILSTGILATHPNRGHVGSKVLVQL